MENLVYYLIAIKNPKNEALKPEDWIPLTPDMTTDTPSMTYCKPMGTIRYSLWMCTAEPTRRDDSRTKPYTGRKLTR